MEILDEQILRGKVVVVVAEPERADRLHEIFDLLTTRSEVVSLVVDECVGFGLGEEEGQFTTDFREAFDDVGSVREENAVVVESVEELLPMAVIAAVVGLEVAALAVGEDLLFRASEAAEGSAQAASELPVVEGT